MCLILVDSEVLALSSSSKRGSRSRQSINAPTKLKCNAIITMYLRRRRKTNGIFATRFSSLFVSHPLPSLCDNTRVNAVSTRVLFRLPSGWAANGMGWVGNDIDNEWKKRRQRIEWRAWHWSNNESFSRPIDSNWWQLAEQHSACGVSRKMHNFELCNISTRTTEPKKNNGIESSQIFMEKILFLLNLQWQKQRRREEERAIHSTILIDLLVASGQWQYWAASTKLNLISLHRIWVKCPRLSVIYRHRNVKSAQFEALNLTAAASRLYFSIIPFDGRNERRRRDDVDENFCWWCVFDVVHTTDALPASQLPTPTHCPQPPPSSSSSAPSSSDANATAADPLFGKSSVSVTVRHVHVNKVETHGKIQLKPSNEYMRRIGTKL